MAIGESKLTHEQIAAAVIAQQTMPIGSSLAPQVNSAITEHELNLLALQRAHLYNILGGAAYGGGQVLMPGITQGPPSIAGSVEAPAQPAELSEEQARQQLINEGYTNIRVVRPQESPKPNNNKDKKRWASTRPRKSLVGIGAIAGLSASLYVLASNNDTARDVASGMPVVGSHFSSAEVTPATDSDVQPEVLSEVLNQAITNSLTIKEAKQFANSGAGTPESNEDESSATSVTQPVELTTDVGVLSGDAVSLNLKDPNISWQIKIDEPKFTFTITEGAMVGKIALDPSSLTIVPVINSSAVEWNTVTGNVINDEIKKINPAVTEEQLAAAKTKADADLTASSPAVGQFASQKILSELLADANYIKGLKDELRKYLSGKLLEIYNNPDLLEYKVQVYESSFAIDIAKILSDYDAAIAANPAPEMSPNVKVASPVKGIKINPPTSDNNN